LNRVNSPRKADLTYLRILKMAAEGFETDVAMALEILLSSGDQWSDHQVAEMVQPIPASIPDLQPQTINLSIYDQLLCQEDCHVSD
jgi:hypothetical protein